MVEKKVKGKVFGYDSRETPDSEIVRLSDSFYNNNRKNPIYVVLSSNQVVGVYKDRRELLGNNICSALETTVNYSIKNEEIVIIGPESESEKFKNLLKEKGIESEFTHLYREEIEKALQKINRQKPLDLKTVSDNFGAFIRRAEKDRNFGNQY